MEEQDNFLKVFKLLTSPAIECVRHIFDKLFPPATLTATLNSTKNTTILQDLKRKRRITAAQDALLFPTTGAGATSATFDLTLMICLIRNLTSTVAPITPPTNGWDMLPPHTETSMGADIARIKYIRNLVVHSDRNVMTNSDFNTHWSCLYDAILRQGGAGFKPQCDDIKKLRLVSDVEIQDFIRQVEEFKQTLSQTFKKEITVVKRRVTNLQTDVTKVKRHYSGLRTDATKVKRLYTGLRTDVTKVKRLYTGLRTDIKELKELNQRTMPTHIQDIKELKELNQRTMPTHIQEQFKREIDVWRKEDEKFVDTAGSKHVMKCIEENGCVSVIGNSGTGKTFTARHTALQMEKKGYLIIPLSNTLDLSYFEHDHKTLFVNDDLCGKFTLNEQYWNDWKRVLEKIESYLKDSCCKIITTCRLQVYQDVKFKMLSVFSKCTCNLSSPEFSLTHEEIQGFKESYLSDDDRDLPESNEDIDFYPLLFSLYKKNKNKDIKTFFNDPFECYTEELDTLENEGPGGRRKYCMLVLCVLFNNTLCEKDILGKTSSREEAINEVRLECGVEPEPRTEICKELNALQDTFVTIEDASFKIIHDKLFDFLAKYFGKKMTDIFIKYAHFDFILDRFLWSGSYVKGNEVDYILLNSENIYLYIDRLIDLWKEENVQRVFENTNLVTSDTFRESFYKHLNEKPFCEQAQLVLKQDNKSCSTPLSYVSYYGDYKSVQWMLKFPSIDINHSGEDQRTPLHSACCGHLDLKRRSGNYDDDYHYDDDDDDVDDDYYYHFDDDNDDSAELLMKCCNNHIDVVKILSQHNDYVDKSDIKGCTPLLRVCKNNDLELVKLLLKSNKIDVNACNVVGENALYLACSRGNVEMVQLLLPYTANINKPDKVGWTALHIACYKNHVDVVKELLKSDQIDVDICENEGDTSLKFASQQGNAGMVRLLLQHSVNINKPDDDGWTPLHIACYYNHVDVVKELLKSDQIDVDVCENQGDTSLHLASQEGNADVVRLLLQHTVNMNKPGKYGWTPLHKACYNNHKEVIQELLKSDHIDVDVCDNDGDTSLHLASQKGNADVVRLLLHHSANINKPDNDDWTPLHTACYKNHIEVVTELLKSDKIDVDVCENEGNTSLHLASQEGNADVVRLLLYHTVNMNKPGKYGWTPLHKACYNNHIEVIQELLKSDHIDVDVCDNDGDTSLHLASQKGNADVVRLLLHHSANINKPDNDDWTPLHTACYKNHIEVVTELLKSDKIDVDVCENEGNTSLHLASQEGNADVVRLLLYHTVNMNKPGKYGWTPLHKACYNNHIEVIQELLKSDHIDVDVCDNDGDTSLHLASQKGNADVVRLLLHHSANINKPENDDWTPLHTACYKNHIEVVTELLKSDKIDVDVCENEGDTSLHLASQEGNADVVRLLLHHTVNMNKQDKNGSTPLHKACYNNHIEVIQELLKSDHIDVDVCDNDGNTSFHLASQKGNAVVVRLLLKHSVNINKPNKNGWTPLHIACYHNHVDVVKELLRSVKIDVDVCENEGNISLKLSCQEGNTCVVRLLLQHSVNINKQDKNGWTPLHRACYSNNVDVVKELLKSDKIDVDVCKNEGDTSLHLASQKGNADVVRLLLQHSANINKQDKDGWTPLHIACYEIYVDVVNELLKSEQIDGDICANNGDTSLHLASQKGNADVVRLLIHHSVNINKQNKTGWTPLHRACCNNHVNVVKELLKSDKIDVHACNNKCNTALHLASQNGNCDVVRLLLQHSANINIQDKNGLTPLHIACYNNHVEVVKELLKSDNIDVDVCENEGFTPLIGACHEKNVKIVQELLKCQADINAKMYDGDNALISASRKGSTEIVEILLHKGSNPNDCIHHKSITESILNSSRIRTLETLWYNDLSSKLSADSMAYLQSKPKTFAFETAAGSSSLHFASLLGYVSIVKLLIQYKADVNLAKEDGTTPLFFACEFGQVEVVKLLLNEGANTATSRTDGVTPLGIAINNGYFVVVYYLMKHNQNSFDN